MASCLYEGVVRHRRSEPVRHEFRQSLYLMYLDLDELPSLFRRRWLWSAERPAFAWFRREDHFGPREQELAESVRDLVFERTGTRPTGAIRLLTNLRYLGFVMNPISLFYCFDELDRVSYVVAEVTNTPWGERCLYVLDMREQAGRKSLRGESIKQMHVSPFLGMNYAYEFALTAPGPKLAVQIKNRPTGQQDDRSPFDATLLMHRKEIDGWSLARVLISYPCMTGQVFAGIYWQAFRLWRKKVPLFNHPGGKQSTFVET